MDGEYGTSATYLSKTAAARYCGFWSSFQCLTLMSGQLLALQLGLQQMFMPAQLGAWGLRVLFVISDVAALGVLCLRTHMGETAAFEQRQQGPYRSGRCERRKACFLNGPDTLATMLAGLHLLRCLGGRRAAHRGAALRG